MWGASIGPLIGIQLRSEIRSMNHRPAIPNCRSTKREVQSFPTSSEERLRTTASRWLPRRVPLSKLRRLWYPASSYPLSLKQVHSMLARRWSQSSIVAPTLRSSGAMLRLRAIINEITNVCEATDADVV